jgi:hypothetical protein
MKKIVPDEFSDFIPPRNVGFHVELASYLREKLESNQFSAGDCFPSLRELAAYWHTNPYTVKLAINELVLRGYLTRSQGQGTFVAPKRGDFTRLGIYIDHSMRNNGNIMYTYMFASLVEQKLAANGASCIVFNDYRDFSEQNTPPQDLVDAIATGKVQAIVAICWRDFLSKLPVRYFLPNIDYHLEHVVELVKQYDAKRTALIAPFDIYEDFPERFRRLGLKLMPKYIRQFPLCGGFMQNCGEAVYNFTKELLTRTTRPDLLIVMPDSAVQGAIQAIMELNIRVPEDLRLILHRNRGLEYFCALPVDYWDVDLEKESDNFVDDIMKK